MLYGTQTFSHWCSLLDWNSEGLPGEIRIKHNFTLDSLESYLTEGEEGLDDIGLPVEFERDQIEYGNMLQKNYVDCTTLKNTEHPNDYFKFTFTVRKTGNISFIGIYRTGSSALNEKQNVKNARKESSSLFSNILGAATTMDTQAFDAENDYYTMVADVIKAKFMG